MSDIEYVVVMHDGSRSTKFMSEAYCKDLMKQLAAAQSQEVCTVAHDNVETCGYCQRDALAARLAEAERDAARYRWLRDDMARIDPVLSVVAKVHHDRRGSEWCNVHDLDATVDRVRAASSADEVQK